jgi:hypothetical protein
MALPAFLSGVPDAVVAARPRKVRGDTAPRRTAGRSRRSTAAPGGGAAPPEARARRVAEEFARTADAVKLRELQRACEFTAIERLADLDVPVTIQSGVIYFEQPKLAARISAEVERVATIAHRSKHACESLYAYA